MSLAPIFLVARRDYFAYVGAWGFWVSLLTAPILFGVLMFAPVILARTEPPRVLAVIADQASDATLVRETFERQARDAARLEVRAYVSAAAPGLEDDATRAFDAAPTRRSAITAARNVVRERAPGALTAFPSPSPRYLIANAPAPNIEGLRPYLTGGRTVTIEGAARGLYGVLRIRRDGGAPKIEYWSVNLSQGEPSAIAAGAMRLAMRREALAARGLDPLEADRLDGLAVEETQFDPRPASGGGAVTNRERLPFIASLALAFLLWTLVFSVANMLLASVIEEKSNKILDTLLTSVTPLQMLIGKLLGVAAVSVTLFLVWGALGGVLLSTAATQAAEGWLGQFAAALIEPRLIAAFLIGFLAGYLMYGAIFLALGSLCESIQESQTLLGPVALVLAMPMMLMAPALENPNAPIIQAASWFPLFTPFLLLMRAPTDLSWTEIAGMGAVMTVSLVIVLALAARVFRAGIVHQVSLSSLFRGGKHKKAEAK